MPIRGTLGVAGALSPDCRTFEQYTEEFAEWDDEPVFVDNTGVALELDGPLVGGSLMSPVLDGASVEVSAAQSER